MPGKDGGKAKVSRCQTGPSQVHSTLHLTLSYYMLFLQPLKAAKKGPKDYDDDDLAFLAKKKEEVCQISQP